MNSVLGLSHPFEVISMNLPRARSGRLSSPGPAANLGPWSWLLWGLTALVLLAGSFWGLPDAARVAIITGGQLPGPAEIAAINASRQRHLDWEARHGAEAARRLAAGEELNEGLPRWAMDARLGPEESLITLRAYLLGSEAMDERHIFHALSRMDPARLQLDPGFYVYGGAYVYPVGVALFVGKLLGLIDITSDLGHYFQHPEHLARMYLAGRWLSIAGYLGVMLVLGLWARRLAGPGAALLAMAAWVLSSLPFWMALVTKPHTWAAAWGLLALYLLHRREGEDIRPGRLWFSGACLGLAMGSTITSGFLGLVYPIFLFDRRRPWAWLGQSLLAGLAALALFLLTNPYAILNFYGYVSQWILEVNTEDSARGSLLNCFNFWRYLLLGDLVFPLILLGPAYLLVRCWRGPEDQRRLAWASLVLGLILGGVFGHRRVALVLGSLLCLLSGLALDRWLLQAAWAPVRLRQGLLGLLLLPGLATQGLAVHDALFDQAWLPPTRAWLAQTRPALEEGVGVFGLPDPTNQPPLPWARCALVNLRGLEAPAAAPRYVLLGNGGADRREWAAHPLRPRYRLAAELGWRSSYDCLSAIRLPSEARTAGWVYELAPAGDAGGSPPPSAGN